MPKVKLVVQQKTGKLTINGMDSIEFLISANLGEAPKPIAKIASGGELSRIMLALKNVIAEKDSIGTLIFDEIDTGVSGRAAQKIGIKLKQISRLRQVLCVTHLAQMAVMADNHLLIEKNIQGDRTVTTVRTLDHEQRKYEIARIMGGENITELMLYRLLLYHITMNFTTINNKCTFTKKVPAIIRDFVLHIRGDPRQERPLLHGSEHGER